MLVEIVNNDTNEKIEGEEGAEDDEDDKVDVHVEVDLIRGLLLHLGDHKQFRSSNKQKNDLLTTIQLPSMCPVTL